MTNVTIYRNKQKNIVRYKIEGHTGFNESGKDIVCAAVSAVAQTAALGLIGILNISVECEMKDAYFECNLPEKIDADVREKVNIILETMILGIKEFEDQYSKYIRISETEV